MMGLRTGRAALVVLVVLVGLMGVLPAAAKDTVPFSIVLDCGFDDAGDYIVHRLDADEQAVIIFQLAVVSPGDPCVEAYAKLVGRVQDVLGRKGRLEVSGPVSALLHQPAAAVDPACDLWDISGSTVQGGPGTGPPARDLAERLAPNAVLKCEDNGSDELAVLYLDAHPRSLIAGLESETRCAAVRPVLMRRIADAASREKHAGAVVVGPVPARRAIAEGGDVLTFQYRVEFGKR